MKHKCLAAFLVFLLFFTISGIIGFYQVQKLTSPDFVVQTLNESGIYNNLDNLGDLLAQSNKEQSPQSKMFFRALTKNVDPNWVKSQIETNMPLFTNYLSGKNQTLDIVFDLTKYKQNLPASLKQAIEETAKELPSCQEGQPQTQDNFPICLPQGTTPEQITAQISPSNLQSLVNEIPNTYKLSDAVKNPEKTFYGPRLAYKILNIGFIALIILTIIFLGLLAILGLSYWPALLKWIGLALVLPAGLNLLLDGIFILTQISIQNSILKGVNPQFLPIMTPIIESLNRNLMKPGFLISGIIFGVGLILIILSYAIPHLPEPKIAKPSAPPPQSPQSSPQPQTQPAK